MDWLRMVISVAVCTTLLVLGLLAVTVVPMAALDIVECIGFGSGTGLETKWRWGCYAKVNGDWIPKQFVFGNAIELRQR